MKDTRVLYFSAFRHVVPEDFERWFEELTAAGWHPVKVGQWSSIAMRFERSEPRKYRYVIDMQAAPKRDYRPTYESFGWEFVGQMASAPVWHMAYAEERPESFSDARVGKRAPDASPARQLSLSRCSCLRPPLLRHAPSSASCPHPTGCSLESRRRCSCCWPCFLAWS